MNATARERQNHFRWKSNYPIGPQPRQLSLPRQPTYPRPQDIAPLMRTRIIVVPSDIISLVSLHNVKELLEERRFEFPSVMRSRNLKLLEEVMIYRTHLGVKQKYRVIDNVASLTKEEWLDVVAVFVLIPETQFIGWPFHGDPVAIVRHVCAFHIQLQGHPVAYQGLTKLNINMLHIFEQKHQMDYAIMNFWRKLDQHMAKPYGQMGHGLGLGLM